MKQRWIVVAFERGDPRTDAMIVPADSEAEAARLGANWLQELFDETTGGGAEAKTVYVAPWDGWRVAYTVELATRLAEFQCCGGGPGVGLEERDGHWGGCPEGPRDEVPT